jgi:hypothetical protein
MLYCPCTSPYDLKSGHNNPTRLYVTKFNYKETEISSGSYNVPASWYVGSFLILYVLFVDYLTTLSETQTLQTSNSRMVIN